MPPQPTRVDPALPVVHVASRVLGEFAARAYALIDGPVLESTTDPRVKYVPGAFWFRYSVRIQLAERLVLLMRISSIQPFQ